MDSYDIDGYWEFEWYEEFNKLKKTVIYKQYEDPVFKTDEEIDREIVKEILIVNITEPDSKHVRWTNDNTQITEKSQNGYKMNPLNALDELLNSVKPITDSSENERLSGSGGSGSDEPVKQNMTEEERKREEKKEKLRQYKEQMMHKASQKKLEASKNEPKKVRRNKKTKCFSRKIKNIAKNEIIT